MGTEITAGTQASALRRTAQEHIRQHGLLYGGTGIPQVTQASCSIWVRHRNTGNTGHFMGAQEYLRWYRHQIYVGRHRNSRYSVSISSYWRWRISWILTRYAGPGVGPQIKTGFEGPGLGFHEIPWICLGFRQKFSETKSMDLEKDFFRLASVRWTQT